MYSHIVELPKKLQGKVSNRLCDLHKKMDEQDEDVQTLFKGFEKELMSGESVEAEFLEILFPYLDSEGVLKMEDMMEGPIGRFARYILSTDLSTVLCQVQQAKQLLIHGQDGCLLSFRLVQRRSIIRSCPSIQAERFGAKILAPRQARSCG